MGAIEWAVLVITIYMALMENIRGESGVVLTVPQLHSCRLFVPLYH